MKNYINIDYNNGDRYYGEANNNIRNGSGEYVFGDGARLLGNFVDDKIEGFAKFYYIRKSPIKSFEANFLNNKVDGLGKFTTDDGEIISNFREDYVIRNVNTKLAGMVINHISNETSFDLSDNSIGSDDIPNEHNINSTPNPTIIPFSNSPFKNDSNNITK